MRWCERQCIRSWVLLGKPTSDEASAVFVKFEGDMILFIFILLSKNLKAKEDKESYERYLF